MTERNRAAHKRDLAHRRKQRFLKRRAEAESQAPRVELPLAFELDPSEDIVLDVVPESHRNEAKRGELVGLVDEAFDMERVALGMRGIVPIDVSKAERAVSGLRRSCANVLRDFPAAFWNIWPEARNDFVRAQARAISLEPLLANRRKRFGPCAGVRVEMRKLVTAEKADALLAAVRAKVRGD